MSKLKICFLSGICLLISLTACDANIPVPSENEIQSGNVIMLPPPNASEYPLSGEENFRQQWGFVTPENGTYYFSLTLDAVNIANRPYSVRLTHIVNGDTVRITAKDNRSPNSWEYYPLEGGTYQIIVLYDNPSNDDFEDGLFSIQHYELRNLNCQARVVRDENNILTWEAWSIPSISGTRYGTRTIYPITTGIVLTLVGKISNDEGTWYEILYPTSNTLIDDNNELVTAWMHEHHLDVNLELSPDCAYID